LNDIFPSGSAISPKTEHRGCESPLADIAADLVGPDVKFHSSKLNYKHPGSGEIVRGAPATVAHLDPTPCPVPPDWSKQGYGSIFTAQNTEL